MPTVSQGVWIAFGVILVAALLTYTPTIGAGIVILLAIYLALRYLPQLP